jgi:hypothetical protein
VVLDPADSLVSGAPVRIGSHTELPGGSKK